MRELERLLAAAQSEQRLPSVSAGLLREGEVVWRQSLGIKEPGIPATPELQYRIGSITKTFCAVAIMQLRDAGGLGLDDPLGEHLPDVPPRGPTIRRMLSHTSGLQREPVGDIWEMLKPPSREELLASMAEAERIAGAFGI